TGWPCAVGFSGAPLTPPRTPADASPHGCRPCPVRRLAARATAVLAGRPAVGGPGRRPAARPGLRVRAGRLVRGVGRGDRVRRVGRGPAGAGPQRGGADGPRG